ncbi:MAG: acetate--CoA ligase family protein [Xanthobacteraceae bacterium]|nr:acetate--CoA ligase family protein [Xanthobacteraceae bacterium]
MTHRTDAIGHLFHPTNVVLVGASDRPGHWSQRVYDNLKRFGFAGKVFPVNPNRNDIWGTPCYPKLEALPEGPDHLAIFTPAETTIKILEDGGAAGARSATVYAAGFGEGGDPDGRRRGAQLRDAIARTGITVIGPTCMGAACGAANFSTVPDESLQRPMPSPVAIAVQSGAMATVINRAINDLGLKTGYLASCGSQLGCRISDFIDYFATVPELRVILCYIEGVPDAAHFLEAARRARANGKTIVAVKVGASEASRAAALAHTGSLAGSAEAFDAVAGSAGVILFNSFEDAIEAVEFLARLPLPRGHRMAVMSNSGALRSLITEAAERSGATLATLSDATAASIGAILEQPKASNPLDTIRTIPEKQYRACLDTLVDAPEIDIVLAAEDLPVDNSVDRRLGNLLSTEDISRRAESVGKTLAVFTPLLASPTDYGRAVREKISHVPMLRGTERALRIVSALARAGARPIHAGPFVTPPADTELVRRWRARAATLDRPTALNEVESKTLLAEFSIPLPPEQLVSNAQEAAAAAQAIGFPVVLKAVSAALPHKSDAGLVCLNLADADAVRQAAATIAGRASSMGITLDGMLVAQQVSGGTEVVLGVQRDVEMGPVIMFGMGGVLVELFKDVRFAPATLDREQARTMVRATRAGAMLDGFRGRKPGDIDALCDALVGLGRLAHDLGDVIEAVDVNPLLVREQGVVALDALVVLRPPGAGQ